MRKLNAYGFGGEIHFPESPYDGYIYMDHYYNCWEYSEDKDEWINIDAE